MDVRHRIRRVRSGISEKLLDELGVVERLIEVRNTVDQRDRNAVEQREPRRNEWMDGHRRSSARRDLGARPGRTHPWAPSWLHWWRRHGTSAARSNPGCIVEIRADEWRGVDDLMSATPAETTEWAGPVRFLPPPDPHVQADGSRRYQGVTYAAERGYRPLQLDVWCPHPRPRPRSWCGFTEALGCTATGAISRRPSDRTSFSRSFWRQGLPSRPLTTGMPLKLPSRLSCMTRRPPSAISASMRMCSESIPDG